MENNQLKLINTYKNTQNLEGIISILETLEAFNALSLDFLTYKALIQKARAENLYQVKDIKDITSKNMDANGYLLYDPKSKIYKEYLVPKNYDWDQIYVFSLEYEYTLNLIKLNKEVQINAFQDSNQTNSEQNIFIILEQVIKLLSEKEGRDIKHKRFFNEIFSLKNEETLKSFLIILKNILQYSFMTFKSNDVQIVKLLKLAQDIFYGLLQYTLIEYSFYDFLFIEGYEPSKKQLKNLLEYIVAVCDKDTLKLSLIFSKFNIKDPYIQEVINDFLLLHFMKRCLKEEIYTPYTKIYDTIITAFSLTEKNKKPLHALRYKVLKHGTDLGSLIINLLMDKGILYQKVMDINDSTVYLQLKEDYNQSFAEKTLVHRPYLTKYNLNNLMSNKRHKLLKWVYWRKSKIVHENPNIDLKIKDAKGFKHFTKYSIDKNYLCTFLSLLYEIALYTHNFNTVYKDSFNDIYEYFKRIGISQKIIQFLTVYDIDYSSFENLVIKQERFRYYFWSKLVPFSYDFNILNSTSISNELKDDSCAELIPYKPILVDLLNKITQQKLYLLGLLKAALFYSPFKYFIHDSFLDSRGRVYNSASFTNTQNYPLSKMLVKLYTRKSNITVEDGYLILRSLQYKESHMEFGKELEEMNNLQLVQKSKQIIYNYILSFFKPNISLEDILNLLEPSNVNLFSDEEETLQYIFDNIKKKKKLYIVHSIIEFERKNIKYKSPKAFAGFVSTAIELDANASGTQIIASIFGSEELAKLCNLIGDTHTDLYSMVSGALNENLVALQKFLNDFFLDFINLTDMYNKNAVIIHPITKLEYYLRLLFYTLDNKRKKNKSEKDILDNKSKNDILDILNILEQEFLLQYKKLPELPKNLTWVLTSIDKTFISKIRGTNKSFIEYLYVIKKALSLEQVYFKIPWLNLTEEIWFKRELFKRALMTFFYNSTSYGRKEYYKEFFKENSPNNLLDEYLMFYFDVLNTIIDRFFLYYVKTKIPDSFLTVKLTKTLLKKKQPIIIDNPFFVINFNPTLKDSYQIQTPRFKGKRGYQLRYNKDTDIFDAKKAEQSFSANLIHSGDALIVHFFIKIIREINKMFKEQKICYQINFSINHDNFSINHDNFCTTEPLMLRAILKECYITFYHLDYLKCIKGLTDEDLQNLIKLKIKERIEKFKHVNPYAFK